MARTILEIKQEMMDTKATLTALDGLTSTSQVSIFGNLLFVAATEINILIQLIDLYILQIESIINEQAVGSTPWLRAKILDFQYGDFVELNTTDFSISYPVVNEVNKIITRCSVKEVGNLIVQAKVAKSDPPEALAALEITALEDYIDRIKPAGTQINVVSLNPDRLYVVGTIYYSGQYSSVIQTNVEAALTAYMTNLSSSTNFDGVVKLTEVEGAIQAVAGVTDVDLIEVGARPATVAFVDRTVIYSLATGVNIREYATYAGYIIEEDDAGHLFTDSLTYVAA